MTATNGERTVAHELLALQHRYSLIFAGDLPQNEKTADLDKIAELYAAALVRFTSTTSGARAILS